MKIEYYAYYPIVKKSKSYPKGDRKYVSVDDIRKQLPNNIANELIQGTVTQNANCICVETAKTDVVAYLDKVMKIEKNNFSKRHHIEITEDEIENYDYFFVGLRDLEWGKQINYEFKKPTCKVEPCPWGAQITSPTRIKSRSIRSLNLGEIYDIWEIRKRFVISKMLKDIFDSEGVTGLKYEPCLIEHQKNKKGDTSIFEDRFYVAEIEPSIAQYGSDIYLHEYCKEHSIIICYDICNVAIPCDIVLEYDFQMINRVVVEAKDYRYRSPFWFVSRRVLQILLKHAPSDLRARGVFLKKSFIPVSFEDCVKGTYYSHSRKSHVGALLQHFKRGDSLKCKS